MLLDILYTVAAFVVAIAVLVAIHEFGHFWVAKRMGVKVLRFSIGFGKPLWRHQSGPDQTEYVVATLPLGGYVKMLDEREGEVAESDLPRAFNRQPLGKRFAIVAAGPVFNFLFAILAYWLVFVVGVTGVTPVIGGVAPDTPAARAGLESGETIVAVNGRETPVWDAALQAMLPEILDRGQITFSIRGPDNSSYTRTLDLSGIRTDVDPAELFPMIGIQPWRPPIEPVVGQVLEDSPAARAGLRSGDRILRVEDRPIEDWFELVEAVQARPDTSIQMSVLREGERQLLSVRPETVEQDGRSSVRIGIGPAGQGEIPEDMQATYRHTPLDSVGASLGKTWEMSTLTLSMLGKIVTGEASVKNLSGPISIATYAGASAQSGFARFFDFLAIVSISLGILNLLPIPVLDGGHLMYFIVEFFKGSPVSEAAQATGQRVGLALLLMLMSLAFYNDLARLFG